MDKRTKKTAMLRSRCEPNLKREIAQVAIFHGLDESDIVRIAATQFVQQFKQMSMRGPGIFANG